MKAPPAQRQPLGRPRRDSPRDPARPIKRTFTVDADVLALLHTRQERYAAEIGTYVTLSQTLAMLIKRAGSK